MIRNLLTEFSNSSCIAATGKTLAATFEQGQKKPNRAKQVLAQGKHRNGHVRRAEIHWYEAHGIGKRKMKIKRFID